MANLSGFFGRFAPELRHTEHGREIRDLHQRGVLNPEVVLLGRFEHKRGAVDVGGVMREIDDARACCLSGDGSDPRHLQLHRAGLLLRSSGKGLREVAE